MKVTNINIQFENKQIIHSKCFEASSGLLTVIKGESGAGKTSLLNILGFKVEHLGDYVFEDHIVPSNEKKLFAFDNISYIEQNPHFIEDLTISEHIEIIKDIYSIDSIYDIIHDLEVDALLDKYPLQLSGGEKSRVALILGLLKEPNILLIDEPTASLDLDLSKKVIQFLKEYAHKGKIVIVASHDDNVIDSADCLYKIENKTLIKKYSNKNFIPLVKRKKSLVKKVMHLRLYFKKMLKHHKINKIFTIFLSCASIIFIVASSNLGSQAVQNNINYLNSLASKELIVFHPKCGFKELNYSSAGYEEPLTQQEFEKLSQIQHIKTIEKRFDCNLNGGFDFAIDNQSKKDTLRSADDSCHISIYDENKNEYTTKEKLNIYFHTYSPKINYEDKILYQFSSKGVYISKLLAQELAMSMLNKPKVSINDLKTLENKTVNIPMTIPIYNFYGFAWLTSDDVYENKDYTEYYMNVLASKQQSMTFHIAGILKSEKMCQLGALGAFDIYLSYPEFEKIQKQYQAKDTREIYFDKNSSDFYINKLPSHLELGHKGLQTPWQPNGYTVEVDDLQNVSAVIKEIQNLKLNVCNDYLNYEATVNYYQGLSNTQKTYSIIIGTILIVIYIAIKFITTKNEKETNLFFSSLYLTKDDIKNIKRQKYLLNFKLVSISSIVLLFFVYFLMQIMLLGLSRVSLLSILMIIGLSGFIEYFVPMFIEKRINHDLY